MHLETFSLLLSLTALLLIPCTIVLVIWAVQRKFGNHSATVKDLFQNSAIAIVITVAITLGICMVFSLTGYFDSQFYRPSKRDYGMQAELGLNPESISFKTTDGTTLHGWFLPSATTAVGTIIYFQGSDRNISYTTRHVSWLLAHGFNVLAFDYRGYGQSEGTPNREGLVEDSLAAIDYIVARPDVSGDSIVLFGQSMGGQLAINAAALRQEAGIRLVIAEATYARQSYHLSDKLGRLGPLWLVKWGGWLLTSDKLSGDSAIAKLGSTPVLLVHGDADTGVSPYHSERLYAKAAGPKEIWRYQGYEHLRVFDDESNRHRLAGHIRQHLPEIDAVPTSDLGIDTVDEHSPN